MSMWTAVVVLAVIAVLLVALRGAPELARLEVREGELSFRSGRLPPGLLSEFADVLSRRTIAHAVVRVVLEGGRPRVVASGVTDDELQQLRNVAGAYTSAQFRTGRAPSRRRQ